MSSEEWGNGVRWGVIFSLCFVAACTGPEINPPLVIAPLGEEPGASEPTEDSNTVEERERSTDTSVQPGGDALEPNPEPGDKMVMVEATAGGGWTLRVNGELFPVFGAGGDQHLERLVEMGGNSIRTWGVGPDTLPLLDEAHALGLKVMVGLWLNHPEWFDYTDAEGVQAQEDSLLSWVEELKDHPAVLMWGVGNELALTVDVEEAWDAINSLAQAIKELDPNHPTVAVTASGISSKGMKLKSCCPGIDIWGINQYGGMGMVPQWVEDAGWEKPWVITEFGPNGPWETQDTAWGSDMEATSTQKKSMYLSAWKDTIGPAMEGPSLGGYAFVWRTADDASDTWFPLFRSDGAPTASINGIYEAWNGVAPGDKAPEVQKITSDSFNKTVIPGQPLEATLNADDPEGGEVSMTWIVSKDPFAIDNDPGHFCYVLEGTEGSIAFDAPGESGPWRLMGWAEDEGGQVSLSSMPFYVEGNTEGVALPFAVDNHYSPNGWMGDVGGLNREDCTGQGFCSPRCHKWTYEPGGGEGWAGAFWLYPEGNWGEAPGLEIAPGATKVLFKAWSSRPDVTFNFFVGVGADEVEAKLEGLTLTETPQEWMLDLSGTSYATVAGGFGFSVVAPSDGESVDLYLEDIRWVK